MSDSRTNLAPSASSQLLPQGQPAPPREPFSPNATGSYEHHIDLSAYPMEPQSGSPPLGNHTNVYPEDNSEGYPRKAPLQKLDVSRYLNNNSITANLPWVDRPIENPGLAYADRNAYRHRDALSRIWTGPEDDRYLSATDGRLRKLIVQATNEVRCGPKNGTWSRRGIRSVTPIHMRMVYWVLKDRIEGKEDGVSLELCLKWFPACLALLALLFVPADLGGEIRNNGRYEQFKYHFWGYPYIPSNPREAAKGSSTLSLTTAEEINGIAERPLRPRYLCFLTEDGVQIRSVADWEAEHGREAILQYLFISYTSAQFQGPADWDELHVIAAAAAQTAGVSAYWISCSCMPEPEQVSEDVYRISDIVRGAHSLAVILGPPVTDPSSNPDMKTMLQHWGERMWTFPEVLLSPAEKPVAIYTRGGDIWNPHFLPKRNFPAEAWTDAPDSRQLVDHYEGSVVLSPLELVTLALQCLSTRANNTTAYLNGDLTYVLMGLLRRRPRVNSQNTAFQEFCRLSLANDSNRLLERLICLLPRNRDQPWHHIDDAWARSLWDITPLCQVDGVGENDTVILGGGFAAPIRWKSFTPVNLMLRKTLKRLIAQIAIRGVPGFLVLGAFFLGVSKSEGGPLVPFTVLGWLLMIPAIIAVLCSPYLLGALYTGKPWRAQPWLFGFEGYMDKAEIETMIFGTNLNRFKWSPYSSELSRHESVQAECIGVDPTLDPAVRETLSRSQGLGYGAEKVFTLVDTNLMTVTLFTAVRPPVALVLCGSEGGMQRGLLCSYDWKTQTLYKESVLRVDTMVLEKMSRVDRFRLGLRRPLAQTVPVPYTDTPIV